MQTTISNEFLTVTIDTHGAEVVSVKTVSYTHLTLPTNSRV